MAEFYNSYNYLAIRLPSILHDSCTAIIEVVTGCCNPLWTLLVEVAGPGASTIIGRWQILPYDQSCHSARPGKRGAIYGRRSIAISPKIYESGRYPSGKSAKAGWCTGGRAGVRPSSSSTMCRHEKCNESIQCLRNLCAFRRESSAKRRGRDRAGRQHARKGFAPKLYLSHSAEGLPVLHVSGNGARLYIAY